MTEQEYSEIAAACDVLLRSPGTSLARLAIPALHLLNEHPSSLAQYLPLFADRQDRAVAAIPRGAIRAARGLMRSLSAPPRAPHAQGPIDVLIVSHLLKPDQLQQEDDFYFGGLQRQLQERGATSVLVLVNHLRSPRSTQAQSLPAFPRMILTRSVPPATEINIWQQCARACSSLGRAAAGSRDSIGSRLALLASRQALSAEVADNLRMHASVARICQALNPKIVITTYEGTVAERLIWHAARMGKRAPLCVGYQHAIVLRRAHAIRRPVAAPGLDCDPEVVLALGEIPLAALASSPGLRAVRFIEYGSHRRAPLAALPRPQDRPRKCLVLPDADPHECATLFDFALRCARLRSDMGFILRPHPMADTQALLSRQPQLRDLPENVALSVDKPLEQEFAQARYCLYRSSSAAMHAARAGIKPYYLARPGELPCDCLVDCLADLPGWRETVTSPQDLTDRLTLAEPSADSAAARQAVSLCERYVSPVRPAAINELLAMVTR
jgi:hypothetical protein